MRAARVTGNSASREAMRRPDAVGMPAGGGSLPLQRSLIRTPKGALLLPSMNRL